MSDRLRLAIEAGHAVLPDGDVLVLNARADADLSVFEKSGTIIFTRSAAEHQALRALGWTLGLPDGPVSGAVVVLPRAREAQRASMQLARLHTAGPIIVDGDKTDGVDAFYRELRKLADVSDAWSKAHGKVFTVNGPDFGDWPGMMPSKGKDGWWRGPGVFSADGIDKASALLVDTLPKALPGRVVDLGAGWGFLSKGILTRDGVEGLDLVEDDQIAIQAARRNIEDRRARFHWDDARTWRPDSPVDHVVTNPPFHTGRAAEPALGQSFIRAAAAMLKPRGHLWLVANRQLPYEKVLQDAFKSVELCAETSSFKVFHAISPIRRKG